MPGQPGVRAGVNLIRYHYTTLTYEASGTPADEGWKRSPVCQDTRPPLTSATTTAPWGPPTTGPGG